MMKLNRQEVERAAFWEHAVCLDCGAEQDRTLGGEASCVECDSASVIPAALILACAAALTEEDE